MAASRRPAPARAQRSPIWKGTLAEAAKAGKPVLLSGRLQPKQRIASPKDIACAAWVERTVDAGNITQTSQVADASLKTKRFGDVPLALGRWRLANPFDPFDEIAEARIAAGDAVLVRARVESVTKRGDGYRDNAVGYRLRAGGTISPRRGSYALEGRPLPRLGQR